MLFITVVLTNPPAIQTPETEQETLETLEYQILEAFDCGVSFDLPRLSPKRALDQAKLQWLYSAANLSTPVSVFATNSSEEKETARIIKFLNTDKIPTKLSLSKLSLRLSGSQMALWRFGQANVRSGKWDPNARQCWEDRLLDNSVHPIIRGFALRHALCWALAEKNEKRFADLKNAQIGEDVPSFFSLFQKTFALLDGPLTGLRLWTSSFNEVSGAHPIGASIWVCPEPDLKPPGTVTAWIIPILDSPAGGNSDTTPWETRANQLLKSRNIADCKMFFAPFQKDFEVLGIALFPALIELEQSGNIKSIMMGDACPRGIF